MRSMAFLLALIIALSPVACAPTHYPTVVPIHNRAESVLIEWLESNSVIILVQTIAVKEEEEDMLKGLWRSVDESALHGTSKKLWNENGLRIGLAQENFIKGAREVLDILGYDRTLSYCRQGPLGHASVIKIGVPQRDKELVIMPEGRRIRAEDYEFQIEVFAGTIEKDTLSLTITPVIFPGRGQHSIELEDLSATFHCRRFEPIVIGASTYDATSAGSAFIFSEGAGPRLEVLMIIYPVFVEQNAQSTSEKTVWRKNG